MKVRERQHDRTAGTAAARVGRRRGRSILTVGRDSSVKLQRAGGDRQTTAPCAAEKAMGIASTAAEVRGLVDGPINRAAATLDELCTAPHLPGYEDLIRLRSIERCTRLAVVQVLSE